MADSWDRHWEPEYDVRSLLRPSEHLVLILKGSHLRGGGERDPRAPPPISFDHTNLGSPSEESRVILAIVGHVDHAREVHGSVFLYTENKAALNTSDGFPLALRHAFAIYGDFSLEISQLASLLDADVLDDSPEIELPPSPTDSRFCLQLSEGEVTCTIVTEDMEQLSSFASACRRFRDSALKCSNDVETYQWLEPYTYHPTSWLSVKPPRDLRLACQPVHLSLSLGSAGQPADDAADYVLIRDNWLWSRSLLHATVRKDSETKQLKIRVGTFNVNGKLPSQDLSSWLGVAISSSTAHNNENKYSIPPLKELSPLSLSDKGTSHYGTETQTSAPEADVLVMAFQEADLSTEAFFNFTGAAREDAWTDAILAALGERAERYEKLVSKQLVGILLIVFVKREVQSRFSGMMESSVATGFMGVMGNKGAVAVRLNYQPSPTPSAPSPLPITFTFVNSHLSAFEDHIDRRNADFHDISRRIEFGPCKEYVWDPRTKYTETEPQTLNIYDSDVLFWIGDLNYRLNLPDADVRHALYSSRTFQAIQSLLHFDELKSSIRHSKAFTKFEEYPINFLPTYRFATTIQTDSMGYDIKRKPAWTDRVLHQSSPIVPVIQKSYDSHPSITMSDHRPVSAEFLVDVPCIDSMTLDRVANDLYKTIAVFDPEDPSGIPRLKLDKSALDFGRISYATPVTQTLRIHNAGKVPAAFRFFPRDLGSPIHPRWLKIEPMAGLLLPGEEKTLQLTIFVSNTIAAPLNLRIERLSTLLIIHTLFGQDLFFSVGGEYEPSCFGTPLSALARLPGSIRELRSPEDLIPETQQGGGHSPREFTKLMGWLTAYDVETVDDLFIAPGDESLAAQMRESLDTGAELPPCPAPAPDKAAPRTIDANYACTVAAVLLAFLRSLPESIVPLSLHQRCAEITSRDEAIEMLSAFPPSSVNVWVSVTAFLHLLALRDHHRAETQGERREKHLSALEGDAQPLNPPSRAEVLASIFAPVLLRDNIDATSHVSLLGKKRFLLLFMGES